MNGLIEVGFLACLLASGAGQTSHSDKTANAPQHRSRHHRAVPPKAVGAQSTAADSGQPLETPAQRAADKHLLQQQQTQSAHGATVTNQIVQQANDARAKVQNEVRIQDAPGPAQTGVVPGAGVPVAPTNADDRIQDAPGPAQTLPRLPATLPTSLPAVPGTQLTPEPTNSTPTSGSSAPGTVPVDTQPVQSPPQ
jgi:hypothetical protein